MNREQTEEAIRKYSRIDADYLFWHDKLLRTASDDLGKQGEVWNEMLDSYSRTLADVGPYELDEVFRLLELRKIALPKSYDYGKLAGFLRDHAIRIREQRAKIDRERQEKADERRYECSQCLDRGQVTAWNPNFLVWFESTYYTLAREGFTAGWYGAANKEWRSLRRGPMVETMRCNCSCRKSRAFKDAQEDYAMKRRGRPPACGMGVFDPETCQRVSPMATADLAAFYKTSQEPQ